MLSLAFAHTGSVVFTRVGVPITEWNRVGAGSASPASLACTRKLLGADIDARAVSIAGGAVGVVAEAERFVWLRFVWQ